MENLTRNEAHIKMLEGCKVRHENYSPEEYVFINSKGDFETEDGCKHGGIYDEFWTKYQVWYTGWSVVEVPEISNEIMVINNIDRFAPIIYEAPKPKQSWKTPYKYHR
jgi:hypothetical protein